jgi:hypothetical protein
MYYLSYILVFNYCLYFTLRHVLFIMQMFIILCIWCLFFIAYIVLLLLFYTCIKILISFYSTYIWFYTKGLDSHDQCSITRCLHWFFQNKNFNYQVLWVFFPFHLAFCGLLNANAHWSPTADDIYGNENQIFFVTVFLKYHLNRKLLLFALKINSVCRKIIHVHSELALTRSSIYK